MSVAFYSSDSESIERRLSSSDVYENRLINIDGDYEIRRCVEWINRNNFSKIALQFPDSLLKYAADIAVNIEEKTQKKVFILGDTSYGSCCVDEIAAEHASANAIIHFGHACLSLTQRFPVLYVFGSSPLDIQNVSCEFRRTFPDVTSDVILYYEVFYTHAISQLATNLKEYENLVISGLEIPDTECNAKVNDNEVKVTKCQRHFIIPKSKDLEDYSVFYIGCQNRTLSNVMLSLSQCKFYTYDPLKKVAQLEELDVNKSLRKRYYYIEKTKDAKIIGILVGTLGVSDYLAIIKHLREVIKAAGKKSYTLVVGKVNVAKLANFAEIEVFVSVTCLESSVTDCYGFYQPIITPYELEIALNLREWGGEYITDFSELIPGGASHISPSEVKILHEDMSLITGRLRNVDMPSFEELDDNFLTLSSIDKDAMTISTIHSQAAGEYLSQRSWKGLQQCLGETPVSEIQEGRKGIACQYDDE